jgi:hypothetical protein
MPLIGLVCKEKTGQMHRGVGNTLDGNRKDEVRAMTYWMTPASAKPVQCACRDAYARRHGIGILAVAFRA